MGKNPLRDLLTRIMHDPSYDQSQCMIEYRDFDAPGGISKARVTICLIEAKNIVCGDNIIPFHRITRVTYDGQVIYPAGGDRAG